MGRRGLVVAVTAAVLAAVAPGLARAQTVEVLAGGLESPRGLDVAGDALYVAEAGRGGERCVAGWCLGATGAVLRVELPGGAARRVAAGLPSVVAAGGGRATGPADVSFRGLGERGRLVTGLGVPLALRDALGTPAARLGGLLTVGVGGLACPGLDVAARIAEAGWGRPGASPSPASVETAGGQTAVLDTGARVLVAADGPGAPRLLATLGTGAGRPTSVALGPDRAYYVGDEAGQVHRVPAQGGAPQPHLDGLGPVVDLAWAPDGALHLLRDASPAAGAALLRVAPDGTRTELAAGQVESPGGLAVGPDGTVYVAHRAAAPGQGQVLAIAPAPPGPGTVVASFRHRDRDVRILERDGLAQLEIDGRIMSQRVFSRAEGGYASQLLAFQVYADPVELARALIDGDGSLWIICRESGPC